MADRFSHHFVLHKADERLRFHDLCNFSWHAAVRESNVCTEAAGGDSDIYLGLILLCVSQSDLTVQCVCLLSARRAAASPTDAILHGLHGREHCRMLGIRHNATGLSEPRWAVLHPPSAMNCQRLLVLILVQH